MKVAITGYSSGIGKSLSNIYPARIGLSRSNGYDINNVDQIIEAVENCDIFINNAYDGFNQVELLYALFSIWKDENKLIVNISSNSGDGIKRRSHIYSIHKTALDKASEQLGNIPGSNCKIINIRPGWVDTPMVSNVEEKKIDPDDLAVIISKAITAWNLKQYVVTNMTILPYEK